VLTTTVSDAVAVLTIDRQHVRNAYDGPTLLALAEALERCSNEGIRVAILTGAGRKSFSAGMDLKAMAAAAPGEVAVAVARFRKAMDDPARVPVIAAVNGPATGGGFETTLRCDLVVAADHATFHLPEVRRGIVPGGGATLLPARIPMAVAMELAILGDPISAERAYQLGLVNRVVPAASVLRSALEMADRLASNGPRAVARTRSLLWTTLNEGVGAAWEATERVGEDVDVRAEMQEGVASFVEKRPPRWQRLS
jgi:enoyl-CoA hydratase